MAETETSLILRLGRKDRCHAVMFLKTGQIYKLSAVLS